MRRYKFSSIQLLDKHIHIASEFANLIRVDNIPTVMTQVDMNLTKWKDTRATRA